MKTFIKVTIVSLFISLAACKKDEKSPESVITPEPTVTTGSLKIELGHMVDTLPLEFGKNYINPKGDTFMVSKFNYFISNIVLTAADNSTYSEPASYHLIKHNNAGNFITIANVPPVSYKSISFMLGVDSAANVSGAQGGDLAQSKSGDMYWGWSSGYIAFKLEGSSPKSGDVQKTLTYHIGGYSGPYKSQRVYNIVFPGETADVTTTVTPVLHLGVNVNKFFRGIDVSAPGFYNHMSATSANNKVFADNYADMISFEHLHNH